MKFQEIPADTPDDAMLMIECDITGKLKKTTYRAAKANVERYSGKYITNWGLAKLNNPMKNKDVVEKVKKTTLERYGVTNAMNQKHLVEERKEKFNNEEWLAQWNEKRKETSLEKYGTEHPTQSEEVKSKQKQTMIENWGVENPLQNKEIQEKVRKTCLEKYGVENPAQSPEIREKMYSTTEERYGVKHYNELPEMRDYLREHCREWLAESWANPWSKGTKRPEEWNEKQRETVDDLISEGKWLSCGNKTYQGWYKTHKCIKQKVYWKSGYELIALFHLDADDNVEFYDYEPFQIDYYDTENKKRHYNVDFIIKYKNQPKFVALEIKNNYTNEQSLNKQKYKYFIEICEEYNIDFEIWKNDKIKSLGYELQNCLKDERVEVIKTPR